MVTFTLQHHLKAAVRGEVPLGSPCEHASGWVARGQTEKNDMRHMEEGKDDLISGVAWSQPTQP